MENLHTDVRVQRVNRNRMLVTRQKEVVFGKNNFIRTFCLAFQKSQVRFKVWNQFPPAIVSNLLGKRPVKMVACLSTNMFWITKPRRVTLMVIRQHTRLKTWNGTLVTVSKWGLPTRQNGETWVSWKQRLPSSVRKIQSLLPLQTYKILLLLVNPLHPNINMHVLLNVLLTFSHTYG